MLVSFLYELEDDLDTLVSYEVVYAFMDIKLPKLGAKANSLKNGGRFG